MNAGRMRQRVVVEAPAKAADTFGQEVKTWSTYATVWAERVPMPRGFREGVLAGATRAVELATFRMRYRADFTAEMRLQFEGRVWAIVGVENVDGLKRDLHLHTVAGEAQE